ncbi:MAG: response regulator transcription factor [Rhodospirillales bacterium]|nr:response regulator transcription factor [Rhodospirillales bacterium]MDE2574366.1 response regulator transcription factor [Rhodospirillales bacterium]
MQRTEKSERTPGRLRVLIVEDTPTVAATLQAGLHAAGLGTDIAQTGAEALARKASFAPDIVLVDLGLPDMSGLDLVRSFADAGDCGVIVVTANGEEAARVEGLDTGADDYVVKPVRVRELAARIRALHRRMGRPNAVRPGIVSVDRHQRLLLGASGARVVLTEAEFATLETLLDAEGASVSRDWLSRAALKRQLHPDDRSVDQLVLKLRRKLVALGLSDRAILSARRQGYVIPDSTLFRAVEAPPAPDA